VSWQLRVDPIACAGHGLCRELLPEVVTVDDWGYPIVEPGPVPNYLLPLTRRAAALCPTVALALERIPPARPKDPGFQRAFNPRPAD
jgi:ferredoxin